MITDLHRRLGTLAVAVLLGGALAACGGAPEKDDLEDALLSSADIPDGFEKAADDDDDDNDVFDDTCLADVDDFEDKAGKPEAKAEVTYEQPDNDLGANIDAAISYYEDDIEDEFADSIDDLKACTKIDKTDDDGLRYDLTLSTEDVDIDDADDAARVSMTGSLVYQDQTFPITYTFIVIRKDTYVSNVSTSEFNSTDLAGQLDDLAEKQFDNVLDLV